MRRGTALTRVRLGVALAACCVGAGVAAVAAGVPGPAGAAGNSGLSRMIIANPEAGAGWTAEPASSLTAVVTYLNDLEADHVLTIGGNAATAVQGWRDPSDHSHSVVVALVALTFSGDNAATVASRTNAAAVNVLASLCAGISAQSSIRTAAITGIPQSHALACTVKSGDTSRSPYAAGWSRANVLALVISTQSSLNVTQMTAVATAQYAAMAPSGYRVAPAPAGASWLATVLELLAGLVVLALAALALRRVLRRADVTAPVPEPVIRRGVVQRPASQAGGVPGSGPTPPRPQP